MRPRLAVVRPTILAWRAGVLSLHPTLCWSAGPGAAIPYDHRPGDGWSLTHIPSGRRVTRIDAPWEAAWEVTLELARLPIPRSVRAAQAWWDGLGPALHEAVAAADLSRVRQLLEEVQR